MALSIVMPALEMAQETGKVVAWLKKEGETVKKGEPLLEIETDKAVVEIEANGDGILGGVKAREGDVIPVGQTIAWLLAAGERVPADVGPAQTGRRVEAVPQADAARAAVASASAAASIDGSTMASARISPKARRLAKERGVDLSTIRGSGAGGEILAEDILAASPGTGVRAPAAAAGPASLDMQTAIGRLMAERTTQSWTSVPHFFVTRDVDAGALGALRDELVPSIELAHGVKPTHTDLLVALVGRVLRKHPRMNASWTGDGIRPNVEVNIAIAMAVDDGVVAAVIRGADSATIAQIAVQRLELTERARANRLQPSDLAGATFTISNLGMYRVDAFTAIIVQPQAGILAVGAITDRVVALDGKPAVRPTMAMTLSSDHRVVDGARAAQFMSDLAAAIAAPRGIVA